MERPTGLPVDFFAYAVIFGALAWFTWNGFLAGLLAPVLLFRGGGDLERTIEEDRTRRLPAGERAVHAFKGIVYGVVLVHSPGY